MADEVRVTLRKTMRSQLTKLIKNVEEVLTSEQEVDKNELAILLDRVQTVNVELSSLSKDLLTAGDDLERECEKVLEYEDKAARVITKMKIKLSTLNKPVQTTTVQEQQERIQPETAQMTNKQRSIKLPKLELRKFDGRLENWPLFWEQFENAVHNNEDLDDVGKFQYLRSLLTGRAAATLNGLSSRQSCYVDAIELLINEYGNNERIIDHYVQELMKLPPVKHRNDLQGLRKLYNLSLSITRSLESLGIPSVQFGLMVKSTLFKALPYTLRVEFQKSCKGEFNVSTESLGARNNETERTLERLFSFLKLEVESAEEAQGASAKFEPQEKVVKRGYNRDRESTASGLLTAVKENCLFCSSSAHLVSECECKKSLEDKKNILKQHRRCYRCTKGHHNSKNCRTRNVKCKKCQGRHVTSMHDPEYKREEDVPQTRQTEIRQSPTTNLMAGNRTPEVYLQTACAFVVNNNEEAFIRLVIDGGSQLTFIKESVSRKLGLEVIGKRNLSIVTFGASKRTPSQLCNKVRVQLKALYHEKLFELEAIEIPEICFDALSVPPKSDDCLKGLNLADVKLKNLCPIPGISLLIGADFYWQIVTGEVMHISNSLKAVNTFFGWTVHGSSDTCAYSVNVNLATVLHTQVDNDNALEDHEIKKFWDLETIGIKDLNADNNNIEDFMLNNVKFNGTRYEVKLPWKSDNVEIYDSNYIGAKNRVSVLTRKLAGEQKLNQYDAAVREFIKNGFAEKVDQKSDNSTNKNVFFMPHRPVYRHDKETTQLRVIFNASSKGYRRNAESINDLLHSGANMIPDLVKILLNFRIGEIGIVADIEKAFLQIAIAEGDRDSHSFLWYEKSPTDLNNLPKLCRYRMNRIAFGVTCSPYVLAVTLKKHFELLKEKYSSTCRILQDSFYVDDLVVALNDEHEAKELYREAKEVLLAANMNLRKWTTNNAVIQQEFAENNAPKKCTKVLGMMWSTEDDRLSNDWNHIDDCVNIVTKRTMLACVAKLFDPLGFLGPFVLKAKLLIQELWKIKLQWDESPPEKIVEEWRKWCSDFKNIKKYTVPRNCLKRSVTNLQLHVFADSSTRAYGCVAYLCYRDGNNDLNCNFLMAKHRLAPLKEETKNTQLTLPRLELTACLCAARMQDYIIKNLNVNITEKFLWTDSQIVLCWISGNPYKQPPYVKNRVKDIRKLYDGEWRHCPGYLNPADLLTRPISAKVFSKSETWTNGPKFLQYDNTLWPINTAVNIDCAMLNLSL